MRATFTKKSSNAKTGPIPVTMTESKSCPDTCPLSGNGCYAGLSFTGIHWRKLDAGVTGQDWKALCESVAALPDGQLWRHNVAGDLPHNGGFIDNYKLTKLVRANQGLRGFTYTHHEPNQENVGAVRAANKAGFTINWSANSLAHADRLAALNAGPVVSIGPSDMTDNTTTPGGLRAVVCPAVTHDGVTCATCKMCARPDRKFVIVFPGHGAQRRAVDNLVNQE